MTTKEKSRNRCERCQELLHPDREVWLEYDRRTMTYTDEPVPEKYSQGGFPFGKACAKKAIAEHKKAIGLKTRAVDKEMSKPFVIRFELSESEYAFFRQFLSDSEIRSHLKSGGLIELRYIANQCFQHKETADRAL